MKLLTIRNQERTILQRVQSSNNLGMIKRAFLKKGVIPTTLKIFYDNSGKLFIYADVYYTARKLTIYKKSFKRIKRRKKKCLPGSFNSFNILPTYFSIRKVNRRGFNVIRGFHYISVRNKKKYWEKVRTRIVRKRNLMVLFNEHLKYFKRYRNALFPRTYPLFADFIRMLDLVCRQRIHPENLLIILGEIFKTQHKKKHNKFKEFIVELLKRIFQIYSDCIIGVSISFGGRIRGKQRSSSVTFFRGVLKTSTICKNSYNSQIHVYNKYGCFGFKMTFNYKVPQEKN